MLNLYVVLSNSKFIFLIVLKEYLSVILSLLNEMFFPKYSCNSLASFQTLLKILFSTDAFKSLHKIPSFTSLYPLHLDFLKNYHLCFLFLISLFSLQYKLHVNKEFTLGASYVSRFVNYVCESILFKY